MTDMSDELEPIFRKIERRALAKPGRTVVAVNQKTGQALSEAGLLDYTINRILNEVVLYEITSDEWLWIDNASAAIAVFPTNERSDLAFRIRLKAAKENATRIAEALHDRELGPAQVLFRIVRNYLGTLLEESTRQGPESAIERIALNRATWQAEVARVIASKLHLDAQLIFQMQRSIIDSDVTIRAEAIAVVSTDARHASFPITVTVVLSRAQSRSNEPLPQSEQERQALVRAVVTKAFRDRISLYTYWYQADDMKRQLSSALAEELGRYAYAVKSLVIDPIVPPVPAEELIVADVNWTGRLARPIPFHVEAKVRMTTDGAGIYHARKLNRKDWIKEEISPALELAMHGRDFIDLTAEAEREVHEAVHRRLKDRAHSIGHEVETFVASAAIPEKIWLKPTTVQVERREYKTKNDLVPAEFEIDLVVELTTLARLEQLIQAQPLTRPNDPSDGANLAIRAAISEAAVRAASRVMSQIEPATYFSKYERWEVPIDVVVVDDGEKNYVRNQLVWAITEELKAEFSVKSCQVSPRRVDSRVATIIRHIQQIGDVQVTVKVEPSQSKGPHEAVDATLNYYIGSVDPDQIANLIQRGDAPLSRDRLVKDLNDWTFEILNGRPNDELSCLSSRDPTSLLVQKQIEDFIDGRVRFHHGVTVGIKSISVGHSEVAGATRDYNALPVKEQMAQIAVVRRVIEETQAPSDEENDRKYLRSRLDVLQRMIAANPREEDEDFRRLEQHEDELSKVKAQLATVSKHTLRGPRQLLELSRGMQPPEEERPASPMQDVTPPRNTSL
jgi:hypothetical protein